MSPDNWEGWRDIARALCVSDRTARRYAAAGAPIRRNTRTGRVFASKERLAVWKKAHDEGEPVSSARPGRAA